MPEGPRPPTSSSLCCSALTHGESVVLTVNTQMGHVAGSSGFVRLHDAYVLLFEDGLIVRHTPYRDIDEAALRPNASPRKGGRPTSEDDLDVMRRWFNAWNRIDLDTVVARFDADAGSDHRSVVSGGRAIQRPPGHQGLARRVEGVMGVGGKRPRTARTT
jgi:hypothetical protein